VDPDPFGVAVSVASILGGLAAGISLYREFGRSLRRSHAKAIRVLGSVQTTIDDIDRDVQVIRERTEAAVPVASVSFGPGQRLLMTPIDFREYAKATEGAISPLRKVLKATHQLERTVPELPYMRPSATRDVVDVQLRIERLLRDPNRSLQ
jgi:hypothetical protein